MVPIRPPLHAFTGKTLDKKKKKKNTGFIAIELSASASVWNVYFFMS